MIALGFLIMLVVPTKGLAQDIEDVIVVGANVVEESSDASQEVSLIEIIMPAMPDMPGGYGGFAGYNERGTQTIHSTVYVNGIPANDSGSGWYDFAHDLSTGSESVKVVTGPNGVVYGSGSLGGAVFVTDSFESGLIVRGGESHEFLNWQTGKETIGFSITSFDVSNGSVKTDNEEEDFYKNLTAKTMFDIGLFDVVASYTDYSYDYDDCYTADFTQSNNCLQQGERGTVSARNNNFTFGYTFNNSTYFTNGVEGHVNKSSRIYVDAKDSYKFSEATITYGVTLDQAEYNTKEQNNSSVYSYIDNGSISFGVRVNSDAAVARLGFERNGWFANIGNSFRNPGLYEVYGDSWVNPNSELESEEAVGGELGYNGLSIFGYNFSEGIDYDFENNRYMNTGSYSTRGIRFVETYAIPYGGINVMFGYTDSDQPRIPKYKGVIEPFVTVGNFKYAVTYSTMQDRQPSAYDTSLDDIQSLDFHISKSFGSVDVAFKVQDVFDDEYEVLPGYNAGGRNFLLTITYK
jgi:outer membrane cobalamin receptor